MLSFISLVVQTVISLCCDTDDGSSSIMSRLFSCGPCLFSLFVVICSYVFVCLICVEFFTSCGSTSYTHYYLLLVYVITLMVLYSLPLIILLVVLSILPFVLCCFLCLCALQIVGDAATEDSFDKKLGRLKNIDNLLNEQREKN